MKKLIIILVVISLFCFSGIKILAQTPAWSWAESATGSEETSSIAADAAGNSYAVGKFTGTSVTFGTYTLINQDPAGLKSDLFIAKYDADGNVVWAKGAWTDMTMVDGANSVATDASGNIYMTGFFASDTILFGSVPVKNKFYTKDDAFIVKFNSAGNAIWAKGIGGNMYDSGRSITVDGSGNVFVTGTFQWSMTIGSTILESDDHSNGSHNDVFLAKYGPNGNFLWAVNAEGSVADIPESVAADNQGNVYITGYYNSRTLTFGTHSITNTNAGSSDEFIPNDIFIAKYDANGNCLWAKNAGGDYPDAASSVKANQDGNIYLTGYFKSPVITIGTKTLTNAETAGARNDLFLAKFDGSGNVLWAKSSGGTGDDCAYSIDFDDNGNIYQAGYFTSNPITFGTVTIALDDPSDCFLAGYDKDGKVSWVLTSNGESQIKAQSVSIDDDGNALLTGNFMGPVNFGSSGLTDNGIFVAKALTGSTTDMNDIDIHSSLKLYPNPATSDIEIETTEQSVIEIYNIQGILIKRIDTNSNKTIIDLAAFPDGIYIFKVISAGKAEIRKIVKG